MKFLAWALFFCLCAHVVLSRGLGKPEARSVFPEKSQNEVKKAASIGEGNRDVSPERGQRHWLLKTRSKLQTKIREGKLPYSCHL